MFKKICEITFFSSMTRKTKSYSEFSPLQKKRKNIPIDTLYRVTPMTTWIFLALEGFPLISSYGLGTGSIIDFATDVD